jgi:uncharacterized protein YbjT (DUF2867 family)
MSNSKGPIMILLTGTTGTVGQAVLSEMLTRGAGPLRAMCRSEDDLGRLPSGVSGVKGDFADPSSLTAALNGVKSAFLVCSPVPNLVELETHFLLACKAAGVEHLVLNSALGAEDFPKSFPAWHRKVEDKARELALPAVFIRPNGFMQNIAAYFAPTITTQDAFFGTIGDAKVSLIDVRDVAAAVVSAILDRTSDGKVFEISGPQAFSYAEVAMEISRATGRSVQYVNLTPQQMLSAMVGAGMPEARATAVLELDEYYRMGKGSASDRALRLLLGSKAPRTLQSYLQEIAPLLAKK